MRRWIVCLLAACFILRVENVGAQPQRYYGTQLQDHAAVFYTALLEHLDSMKTQAETIELTDYFSDNSSLADTDGMLRDLTAACRALKYDYPELFWLDVSQMRMYTSRITQGNVVLRYRVRIEPAEGATYFAEGFDWDNIEEKLAQTEAAVDRIAAEAAQQESDYEKIRVVHDRLVRETSYDQEQRKISHSAYAALVEHKAVCDGYAGAFQMVMERLGIPCISITGEAHADGKTETHMWNAVQVDRNWYGIDVTWDDPVPVEGKFEMLRHNYFLLGEEAMNRSHIPQTTFFEGGPSYELPKLHQRSYTAEQIKTLWEQFLRWLSSWTGWQFDSQISYRKRPVVDGWALFADYL